MSRAARFVTAGAVMIVVAIAAVALVAAGRRGGAGPPKRDYVPIADAPKLPPVPAAGPDGSPGSSGSPCGRNEMGHLNADNMITSPGVPGAAHHGHEYVGNVATNAFSTDAILAASATTCANGDQSTYSWPVLRVDGARVPPSSVDVQFLGNPVGKVVAMPRFLRVVFGNARAVTTGGGVSSAQWSCAGDADRATPMYPLCPAGRSVLRTFEFPSCWDGRRLDSPTHRDHVVFPAANGVCPRDTFAIPRLRMQVAYAVPAGPSYAIDTFPEQLGSPTTDHADFIDVMSDDLMARVVACLNEGRRC
jgi:Domain of unknown function (DUF1996)